MSSAAPLAEVPTLFQHSKRPSWGLAILATELPTKRRYQFQDGRLRTIKEGYYELLEEVDRPYDRTRAIVRDLKTMLRVSEGRRAPGPTPAALENLVPFDDQLRVFRHLFTDGFRDPAWRGERRGDPGARRLKRHRAPAIADAKARLGGEELEPLLSRGDWAEVRERAFDVLGATDLVVPNDRKLLAALPETANEAFATDLWSLLWGSPSVPFEARFDRFHRTLSEATGKTASWTLVTAPAALVHPSIHAPVKPSAFRAQAKWMAPNLKIGTTPSGEAYERLRRMACEVRRRLEHAELPPQDLVDVHDFIWTTLRPKAKQVLASLDAAPAS